MAANFAKFAPDYKRHVLGDDDCIAFLTNHFNPEVVSTFNALRGAHKADLFRYAILYINGGVYLDIKTELIMPLDQLIDHNNTRRTTYTVIDHQNIWIYQGVLASPKGNPLFLHGILKFVHAEKPIDYYFISIEQVCQRRARYALGPHLTCVTFMSVVACVCLHCSLFYLDLSSHLHRHQSDTSETRIQ